MPSQIRAEARKLGTVRGPWLLLAAGPLVVVAGITGLVSSGGNVHESATAARALAHVGLAAVFALVFGSSSRSPGSTGIRPSPTPTSAAPGAAT